MASSNSTGTSKMSVPEAKDAMNKFKMEVAKEIGVNLKDGYNGDLTSAQSGFNRWRDGSSDDQETGRTDVRQISSKIREIL